MKKLFITFVFSLFLITSFSITFAQIPGATTGGTTGGDIPGATTGGTASGTGGTTSGDFSSSVGIDNPLKVNSLEGFIKTVLNIVIKIGVPVVSVFIILAGLQFVLARGNGEKLEKAKQNLLWVLIGAAILLGCWVIAEIISGTINALM